MQYDSISCYMDYKTSGDLAKTTAAAPSAYNNKNTRVSSMVNILSKNINILHNVVDKKT